MRNRTLKVPHLNYGAETSHLNVQSLNVVYFQESDNWGCHTQSGKTAGF